MGSIIGTMGCSSSVTDRRSEKVIRAAILIQNWYRFTMARLEMRRRYSLSIFQSIEYAEEQDQLQLSNFFTFMLDHCTHPDTVSGGDLQLFHCTRKELATAAVSHIFTSPSVSQVVDEGLYLTEFEKKIDVPDSYYGPRLSFPLTVQDANALLDAFRNEQLLHARYVLQLLSETRKLLKEMPNITRLSTSYSKEITVCGDLHGNLDDLLLIFYKNGLPSEQNRYVFNGDFVDRGKNSMEILIILFAFLLLYPNDLHLNRGNHEDYIMNLRYGFTKEVSKKYKDHGKQILCLLRDVFSWLPLATIIDSKVLILHGGISDTTDLDFLNALERSKLKSLMRPPKSMGARQDQVKEGIPTTRPSKHVANHSVAGETQHISSSGSTEPSSPNVASDPDLKEWKQTASLRGREFYSLRRKPISENGISQDTHLTCKLTKWAQATPPPKSDTPPTNQASTEPCSQMTRRMCSRKPCPILDILWSDPRSQNGCTPNKRRGGGCYFGPDVTAKLFERYNLKMLIRSHEFKPEGYEISHDGKVITIFSASNYYEEGSNRGAYIKLNPELIPRFVQYRVSKYTRRQNLRERVGTIESSALKSLREKIYAHRPELTSAFAQYDPSSTGKISVNDWAAAMESVLQLELPWRMLLSQLAQTNPDGKVDFMSCFYDLKIGQPIKEVQPALTETLCRYRKDLEIIFNIIDKDHSGLISLEEFGQTWKLFTSHLGIDDRDDESLDKLVLSIDYNKDGYIDFTEFLEAFHVVHRLEKKANS